LHRQIYERFRLAILHGQLRPGQRVASARALAAQLGLARGTVDAAYAQLAGEGYLEAMGQKGTRVATGVIRLDRPRAAPLPARRAPPAVAAIAAGTPLPLQLGIPALDAFPRKLWSRLGARRIRALGLAQLSYPDPRGNARLREAISSYLLPARGIRCSADQVFITAGYGASLDLACRVLLRAGQRFWLEDPCYPPARRLLEEAGARIVPVPVDEHGMRVEDGIRLAPKAALALVTPSHQAPLGVSLSIARRMKLLAWAQSSGAWIVEDDYDSEFRYTGAPLPALKALDSVGRVLYAGTFSKVLFPGLRLAYLVVPPAQVDAFSRAVGRSASGCPDLTQELVADFMEEGHLSRHIKKMRSLYAQRRITLATALEEAFGDRIRVQLQAGGMHLLARIQSRRRDSQLAASAQRQGLAVQALSQRATGTHAGQALLMGFTNVVSKAQARELAARLRAAVGRA
jgi:GntR family transcriptional regulator/MocR family aminotransferase